MEWWQLIIFGLAGFLSAIASGIAGAGGGFIMTPLGIFLGLAPAQSIATGKLSGLAVTLGSLGGLRKMHGTVSLRRVVPVLVLSLAIGLLVPFVIKSLDSEFYRILLGIILLLMIPVVIFKKVGLKRYKPTPLQRSVGGVLLAVALFLQGAFSGGLGTLVNIVLMGMLGMTALEANLTKRYAQLILNVAIVLGVLGSGLIVWQVAIVGMATTFAGGFVGGHIATRKGDAFVMRVMVVLMLISAVALIAGA